MNNNNEKENIVPTSLETAGKEVRKKSLLLIVSIAMLVAAAVFLTFAWYTKMSSISSMKFDVAQWDYRANYQSDEISVYVYDYETSERRKAAPGTEGYIPIMLNAEEAETDIDYVISVDKSSLSPEFSKRLIFSYTNKDTSEEYRKGYNKETEEYDVGYTADSLIEFDDNHVLSGVIKYTEKTKPVNFSWRWVYDAKEALEKGLLTKEDIDSQMTDEQWSLLKEYVKTGSATTHELEHKWEEYYTAWDEFDTRVGKYPAAFEDDMRAIVRVVGVQTMPVREQTESTADTQA